MIDPNIYREAAAWLAPDQEHYWAGLGNRGMCVAVVQALGTQAGSDPYLDLLRDYFDPQGYSVYWWEGLTLESQQERFMALHFMALIAEDLT